MESFYTINVSHLQRGHYIHFFDIHATSSRYPRHQVVAVVQELIERFPSPEYKVDVAHCEASNRQVNIDRFMKD